MVVNGLFYPLHLHIPRLKYIQFPVDVYLKDMKVSHNPNQQTPQHEIRMGSEISSDLPVALL